MDEDVFALRKPHVVGVRVGMQLGTDADWYLRDQRAIDAFLELLAELRAPSLSAG